MCCHKCQVVAACVANSQNQVGKNGQYQTYIAYFAQNAFQFEKLVQNNYKVACHKGENMKFVPNGVCSREINFEVVDGKVHNVQYVGGCNGNGKGISALVEGMAVEEAIRRLKGIKCGFKSTSCPDQLARALEHFQNNVAK